MNKKFTKTGVAIVGFFAVIALIYYMSTTDILKTDQAPSTAKESPANHDSANKSGDTVAADGGKDTAKETAKILLQAGDTGEDVRELQQALTALGYQLDVDGEYGPTTEWFIKDLKLQCDITGDGAYDTATEACLQQAQKGELKVEPGKAIHLQLPDRIVTNPDDLLALVNKTRSLPSDYVPDELVEPEVPHVFQGENLPYNKMRRVAAEALESLFAAGEEEGLQFVARSGYRSYDTQVEVFSRNVEKNGEEAANKYSARPGESEHQTGLVMDVTSPGVQNELVIPFEDTNEGKWLKDHAADFGFIIRYLKGKEDITGYQYEPWHLRYVGKDAAKAIASENLTLEEYLLRQ